MKLASFTILTVLALLYAGLTITESTLYQRWDRQLKEQRDIQAKVVFFQRLSSYLEQLLKRLATDAQHDPALLQMLSDNKVNVVFNPLPTKEASPSTPIESKPAPDQNSKPAPQ